MDMSSQQPYDVIIIGAGISGIVTARFFLDIHPNCRLAVIERDGAVGGTWNAGL
jgi:dimethylaniline monooxygenase (N-oxide forming)